MFPILYLGWSVGRVVFLFRNVPILVVLSFASARFGGRAKCTPSRPYMLMLINTVNGFGGDWIYVIKVRAAFFKVFTTPSRYRE